MNSLDPLSHSSILPSSRRWTVVSPSQTLCHQRWGNPREKISVPLALWRWIPDLNPNMYLPTWNQALPQEISGGQVQVPSAGVDTLIGEHLSGPILVLIMLFFYFLALCDKWHQLETAENRRLQAMEHRQTTHVSYGATASPRGNAPRPPATVGVSPRHEVSHSHGDSGTAQAPAQPDSHTRSMPS